MLRLLAIVLPPLAVLLCGGAIFAALLNALLCCLMWIPGVIHAWGFVTDYKRTQQTDRIINAMKKN